MEDERFRDTKWFAQDHIHSKKQDRTLPQVYLILRYLFFLLQLGSLLSQASPNIKQNDLGDYFQEFLWQIK